MQLESYEKETMIIKKKKKPFSKNYDGNTPPRTEIKDIILRCLY